MRWSQISTVEELEDLVGLPAERAANKVRPVLHDLDRE